MKIRKIEFLALMALIFAFTACNKGPYPDFEKTEDGLYFKFHLEPEDGIQADSGDRLNIRMRYYTDDTLYFDSKLDMNGPLIIPMDAPRNRTDLYTALKLMKVGDSATFIMPVDSFFGSRAIAELDSIEDIFVDLVVYDIKKLADFQAEEAEKKQQLKEIETAEIQQYIDDNQLSPEPLDNGLLMLDHKKTSGEKLKSGLIAMVSFKGQLLNGDVFQDFNTESFPYVVGESPDFAFQWDPVLKKMRKGETARFIIPAEQAFGQQGYRNLIPPNSPLLLEVKVTDVLTKEEYQEKSLQEKKRLRAIAENKLQSYLKTNNISTEPTQSGLIFIPKKAGNGNKVQVGDTILVHYKGYLLNGDVFDSSYDRGRPMEYIVGSGGLIQGWLEAIPMMEEGEKVQLVIPWRLAYGQQAKGPIPPYSNLVFDMEIVKIKK